MKKRMTGVVTLLLGLLLTGSAWALPINSLYVFGDSLSDAGNNPSSVMSLYGLLGNNCDPTHPCPPYDNGRISNGPVAAEYLANNILPGGASTSNYFSFAVAGATSGIGNYGDNGSATSTGFLGLPGMAQELALFQSQTGGIADPGALYFVWGGANDFLTGDSPVAAAQNVASYINLLASEGGLYFLIPNLPDLGLTPFVNGTALAPLAQGYSQMFNSTLAGELANLRQLFPSADIISFDTYSFLNEVVGDPAADGFTNVQDACFSSGTVCANPNEYLFWDSIHPTTHAHAIIASALTAAVPEPGSLALLGIGLAGFLVVRRKQMVLAA